ncbi:hypothetical protein ACJMK2_028406 [Sinanodonta woodiana]|uniref:Uncharacterized protein n=1 Tax=Sinanodonta woodiana TaxID=1069815 RepID=A0ABD3XAU7_SINWO
MCGATAHVYLMLVHLSPILPAFVFVIITRTCVHFNFILSTLWFITVFPVFIISIIFGAVPLVVAIFNGILSFTSISFAVCAIWKAAKNVVLNAKLATLQQVDEQNGIGMPQANNCQPMYTQFQ